MKYMLDTNICIYIIKKKPPHVLKKFTACELGDICISSVTSAELHYGIQKSLHPHKNKIALDQFMLPLEVRDFDDLAAEKYGEIRVYLEKKGTPIGSMDMMIAAHAASLNITLVTNNKKEFKRVPKLAIEDWA